MARKSTTKIENEMLVALEDFLKQHIGGEVYPADCRPADSTEEDAVIVVSTATASQVQRGRAKVRIYVPDIDNGSGAPVPNIDRLDTLAALDEDIIAVLNEADTDYEFTLGNATTTQAAIADERTGIPRASNDTRQHFVAVHIDFKLITF